MELVQNFPLFAILLYLSGGVICTVLKPMTLREREEND